MKFLFGADNVSGYYSIIWKTTYVKITSIKFCFGLYKTKKKKEKKGFFVRK